MKKIFELTHPKLPLARLVESIKNDIRKYVKRERRRELPEKTDFWGFDCKFGADADSAETIHVDDVAKSIDTAVQDELPSFYLEILAKPGHRAKKPRPSDAE